MIDFLEEINKELKEIDIDTLEDLASAEKWFR